MKADVERFIVPGSLMVFRQFHKEGPPITYLIHQGRSSWIAMSQSDAIKGIRWPKSTPTGAALRDWFKEYEGKELEWIAKQEGKANKQELSQISIADSPHQAAIADGMQVVSNTATLSSITENVPDPQTPEEPLPFEVSAEQLDEFDVDPTENTRMVA